VPAGPRHGQCTATLAISTGDRSRGRSNQQSPFVGQVKQLLPRPRLTCQSFVREAIAAATWTTSSSRSAPLAACLRFRDASPVGLRAHGRRTFPKRRSTVDRHSTHPSSTPAKTAADSALRTGAFPGSAPSRDPLVWRPTVIAKCNHRAPTFVEGGSMRATSSGRLRRGPARPRGRQVARPQPAGRSEALPADPEHALRGTDSGLGAGGKRGLR
jgi:hypothetical protein